MLQEIKRGLLGPVLRARNTRGRSLSAESIEMNAARALVTGDEEGRDEARQQAAQALANARGIPVEEANEQIAQIERRYQQAVDRVQQRATEAADAAASGVSTGAILAFVACSGCDCRLAGRTLRRCSSRLCRSRDPNPSKRLSKIRKPGAPLKRGFLLVSAVPSAAFHQTSPHPERIASLLVRSC